MGVEVVLDHQQPRSTHGVKIRVAAAIAGGAWLLVRTREPHLPFEVGLSS